MAEMEHLTVTLPVEIAAAVDSAVKAGEYNSASEIVRDALHEWTIKRASRTQVQDEVKAEIAVGLADAAAGRVTDFDVARIVERGRMLSTAPSRSG